eukprot:CAMPEP_0204904258 /NCGR_PEP_ID=MMETSP1397-20131031/4766_1 /ASSEMBLY_ACC=CAM_ASM_000891 /TAXON_ID=49980 /ORGANISM="Climacostomum Climacostomum virens, Strain Stock W-24" /LENGTH=175 /DNA_ID=CAMNT_0052073031 /DNA_START=272 /DNA_END=799 /DNA_ORIENTATION=-
MDDLSSTASGQVGYEFKCANPDANYENTYDGEDLSDDYANYSCGSRNSNTDFVEYESYPISCKEDSECKLKDGTYAKCSCALDGNSYCTPHLSSDFYDGYWGACESEDSMMKGYWKTYYDNYPDLVGAPDCASETVYELNVLRRVGEVFEVTILGSSDDDDYGTLLLPIILGWLL